MINHFKRFSLLLFLANCLLPKCVFCQGFERVWHTSGTVQVGCTEVTVTSAGGVSTIGPAFCNAYPYKIGHLTPGSYTFTFSNPIGGVRLDVVALDHFNASVDELAVEVNGSFYPFTNAGVPGCQPVWVEIWPPGTIRAPLGTMAGGSEGITIDEIMTSLTVANNFGNSILFGLYIIPCPCLTDAGEITANPLGLCTDEPATLPPAEQANLVYDDILQYILFSDPDDTLGSIISTANLPGFAFDPATMQTGITYYIAAIAGNDLNGNVDIGDPCLDISNAIEVTWHALPSVSFLVAGDNLCVGECRDIEVYFTGTPPFQLSGEVTDGNNIISTFDNTYQNVAGMFTFCLPANTPVGSSFIVQATSLTDANCSCD